MAKPLIKHWPNLAAYLVAYGFDEKFEDCVNIKVRSDGCYVVMLFAIDAAADRYFVIDVASTRGDEGWSMQNDCSDEITLKAWKGLRIVPECDSYVLPGEEE